MARVDLGVPEEEIGHLTLREYEALVTRRKQIDNRLRFNAGLIAAAVQNCAPFGDPNRTPANALDFVPDWQVKPRTLDDMTPMQQKEYLLNMFCKTKFRG